MWRLLGILALVICSEAMPKKFAGIPLKKSPSVKAISDKNRLDPNSVQPTNYKLDLTVSEDNLNNGNFSGTVAITLTVAAKNTTSFNIHAKNLIIDPDSVTLKKTGFDGNITTEGPNTDNDFLTIKSNKEIPVGKDYVLTILYTGILSDTDMEGFYRSSYKDASDKKKYLAATQFEQLGARRAFPCFDEPFFKAKFDISITYSEGYNAMSNTHGTEKDASGGLKEVTFDTTPKMSTYLVAFIVSDFNCTSGKDTSDKIPTEVCARLETQDTMTLALETAPAALDTMKELTGYGYGQLGNMKMTQAAIPDFAAGAMENWGMVTYREADLLWDEKDSSNFYKQAVVTVITHELSHQWFGDYVTLDWWSDTFLNEGFATYFEYFGAAKIQQEWDLEKQFVIEQVQPVLLTDSSSESKALSSAVSSPDDIEARFDDISYNKGGSIIRMVQSFLGQDNFKKGLSNYLEKHGGQVATPQDLWNALNDFKPEHVSGNIETVMNEWTSQPGYPLLTVKQNGANITVTQEQFLLEGNGKTKWNVPITYTTSNDTSKFTDTTTQDWLPIDKELTILLPNEDDWIILNNQQVGYYRVDYDDTVLDKIATALNTDTFGNIDEISRSQLVDDQLNLARAGKKEYKDVLEFLKFLKKDTSYYSWSSAFNGFSYLLKRTNTNEIRKFLTAYITELMEALLNDKSVTAVASPKQIDVLGQVLALTWACNLDVGTYVKDARDAFIDYMANETLIPDPNLRSIIYCNGLRNSENASEEYNFLFKKYTSTKLATEQVTILKALGCINDSELRKKYLKEALGENVRLQDARYVFQSVYSNNGAEGVNDVVDFILENYKNFEQHFGTKSTLNSLIYTVADLFTTQDQIDKFNTFQGTSGLDESIKNAVTEAAKSADNNLEKIKSLETTLKDYFDTSSAPMNTNHLIHLALIGVVYLIFNFY